MQAAIISPILKKESSPSDQFPDLVTAYGRVVAVLETQTTVDAKIQSIMNIFEEIFEESSIQEQYIEELEKQKQILSKNNHKLSLHQKKLISEIHELSNKVKVLAQENGFTLEKNIQLEKKIKAFLEQKQKLDTFVDSLEKQNVTLTENVIHLKNEKEKIVSQNGHLLKKLEMMEEAKDTLMEQSQNQMVQQEKMEIKLKDIEEKNQDLEKKLDVLNAQKIAENEINKDHAAIKRSILWWMGITTICSGGLILPALVGGGLYGIDQGLKFYDRKKLTRQFNHIAKEHSTYSHTEIMQKVIAERRKLENKYGLNF